MHVFRNGICQELGGCEERYMHVQSRDEFGFFKSLLVTSDSTRLSLEKTFSVAVT